VSDQNGTTKTEHRKPRYMQRDGLGFFVDFTAVGDAGGKGLSSPYYIIEPP
jgi:hypothetical protein